MQSQGQGFVVWGRNREIGVHGWGQGVGLGFGVRGAEPGLEGRSPELQDLNRGVGPHVLGKDRRFRIPVNPVIYGVARGAQPVRL